MAAFLSALFGGKKSPRSRSPSPNPRSGTNDGGSASTGLTGSNQPRKSVPAHPFIEIDKAHHVLGAHLPQGKAHALNHSIKVSLPTSPEDSSPGSLLVLDKNGEVLLDTPLVRGYWGFKTDQHASPTPYIQLRVREAPAPDLLEEHVPESSMCEPELTVESLEDVRESSMCEPDPALPLGDVDRHYGAAALQLGDYDDSLPVAAGDVAADYYERRASLVNPSASVCHFNDSFDFGATFTEHFFFMSRDHLHTMKEFLSLHSVDAIDVFQPLEMPTMMVMTIGQYVNAQQSRSTGTGWLLKGDDLSGASFQDISDIYRSLGASAERSTTVGFKEFPERSFVAPHIRAELISRLDAAFVAAGSVSTDTKLDLSLEELEGLVGSRTFAEIQETFGAPIDKIKMRRVCATAAPSPDHFSEIINFHLDKFAKTMGIPLNDDSEYDGSRLTFALPGSGKLVQPARRAGTATVHDNRIAHGVTPISRGVRYGLFLLSNPSKTVN